MILINQVRGGLGIGDWIYQHESHCEFNKSIFSDMLKTMNRSLWNFSLNKNKKIVYS